MKVKALLFDTRSIQRYIYSSNQLKTNIGASFLVDQVFQERLLKTLRDVMNKDGADEVDVKTWEMVANPDWTVMEQKCRIGYIGGGNALVLFRDDVPKDVVETVVTEFTKGLLETHPGLRTGAAIGTMCLDREGHFLDENEEIIKSGDDLRHPLRQLVIQLKEWQSSVFPETNVPYTGLTQLCPEIGETAALLDKDKNHFISLEIAAKRKAGTEVKNHIRNKLQAADPSGNWETFFSNYDFPDELKKLGQKETENYIAIVHIDGNNMGVKFADCETLTDRKNLSLRLSQKTAKAFADMLRGAIGEYDEYGSFLDLDMDGKKKILPVRPLVLGGDDMTFICTAKLALRYTKRVMEAMLKAVGDEESVDTCAGIAIQPANYPFFRGYMLAEQACDAAKKEMRALRDKGTEQNCWLEFVIRHGEQAPDLSQIREQEYKAPAGDMHFGPYRVDAPEGNGRDISSLIAGLNDLKGSDKQEKGDQEKQERLSMNKIKELRDVISRNADERGKFLRRLREGKGSLPNVPAWKDYKETLWKDGRTPYIDLIEMMDYYEPEGGKVHGEK